MTAGAIGTDCETVDVAIGDRIDHVATVTLSRPDARNALNEQLRTELAEVLDSIAESDVRVVVLTGDESAGAFAAGGDVREMRERTTSEQMAFVEAHRVYEDVSGLPQPVIARINDLALGGGCELALACDLRVAHEDALIGQPEIGLGLIPGGGGTQRLPRLVGEGVAMRLVLTGELLDGERAADIGLVDEVHGDGAFDDRVYELAESMATKSPVALEYGKRAVRAASQLPLDEGIDYEAELFEAVFDSGDAQEGIDAFLDDRSPEWTGE